MTLNTVLLLCRHSSVIIFFSVSSSVGPFAREILGGVGLHTSNNLLEFGWSGMWIQIQIGIFLNTDTFSDEWWACGDGVQLLAWPGTGLSVWAMHTGHSSCWTTASSFRQLPSTHCSTVSARYVRPSHLRCHWTNDTELVPKQFAWARHANWLFSSYTEDVSFWWVLGTLSALEALFCDDALYKFYIYIIAPLHFIDICWLSSPALHGGVRLCTECYCKVNKGYNGLFHFLDQSFAEFWIWTETKDQPKREVIFCLDSAISWAFCWDQTLDWAITKFKAN